MSANPLILASSSIYRQQLLKKLHIDFVAASPAIEEALLPDENPLQMAIRLGLAKVKALQTRFPEHVIIGSDQVAALQGHILTKPGNRENALRQLHCASGQCVDFFTSICVLNSQTGLWFSDVDITQVQFKVLTHAQIERYVDIDQPFDCAGSFKAESFGIALFKKISTDDHNALIGLPLIKLISLLEQCNVTVL